MVAREQHKMLECTDPNNNRPISEASAGGGLSLDVLASVQEILAIVSNTVLL